MFPVLQIGPLALQTPGVILILGLWVALWLVEKAAPHEADKRSNLIFWALGAGILGARISYILRYPAAFAATPLDILSPNVELFDAWGGVVAAGVAALIYGQRAGLPFWPTLDALTPGLAVMGVAIGLSHLASGEAYGAVADLPWAIELWGARRHPSQLYEIIGAAIILGVSLRRRASETAGIPFLSFVFLTAAARLFLEAFRGESVMLAPHLRAAQVAAWAVMAFSLWQMRRLDEQ